MVGGKDPMLSSVDSKDSLARSRSRSLSSDSINDIEPLVYNKQRKIKALKREPRAKKAQNQSRTPVPMQLYNSPRIPVVSRPVFPKISSSSITFPLPKGLKDLQSVSSIYSTRYYSVKLYSDCQHLIQLFLGGWTYKFSNIQQNIWWRNQENSSRQCYQESWADPESFLWRWGRGRCYSSKTCHSAGTLIRQLTAVTVHLQHQSVFIYSTDSNNGTMEQENASFLSQRSTFQTLS